MSLARIERLKNFPSFWCDESGNVFRGCTGRKLRLNKPRKGLAFYRLCYEGKSISITVNKCILLAFKADEYKKGLIAVLVNPDKSAMLSNLKWGTRRTQSAIAMTKPENYKRVQKMGRTLGKKNIEYALDWKRKNIDISLEIKAGVRCFVKDGFTNDYIRENFGISKSTLYRIKKSTVECQLEGLLQKATGLAGFEYLTKAEKSKLKRYTAIVKKQEDKIKM